MARTLRKNLPTPLLDPAETNTHIGFLGCIHLISERILYCINGLVDTGYIQSKIPRSESDHLLFAGLE